MFAYTGFRSQRKSSWNFIYRDFNTKLELYDKKKLHELK